ncbi:complement C1q and tumor necrosis factor-related protein 9-like [Ptychodera flava]|uniref:complement C1q and tumor necrosis factor-related protein 9-like n=1 Tax=Ptychodera flava TaxID=63121 RepID=UPI00396A2261
MFLKNLTRILLLECYIIATLYQLSPCLAEEQTVHTTTGTLQSNSDDSETIRDPRQLCTNSINGVPGIPGIPGSPGPIGPPGVQGQHGQVGSKGDRGDLGADGRPGQRGVPGSLGPKGEKGDIGQKGEGQIGQKGVQGKPGPQGDKGEPGMKGSLGQRGLTGPKGQQGQPGPKGQPGQQGHKGDKGQPGERQQTNRIAFSVSRTAALGPLSQHTPVTYQKIYTNMGNNFDITTGKFTCSVSGVYFFMISAIRKNDHTMFLCLMKNDEKLPCIYAAHSASRNYGSASNSVIIDLQHGDEVWVRLGSGYAFHSDVDEFTTFTGYLLYQNA